jgi:hypothetical protein
MRFWPMGRAVADQLCGCRVETIPISDDQGHLTHLKVYWTRCGLHTAAPELLAALKRLWGVQGRGKGDPHSVGGGCVICEAQAAIAKAEAR